jgi:hypothetical protein
MGCAQLGHSDSMGAILLALMASSIIKGYTRRDRQSLFASAALNFLGSDELIHAGLRS